jgi:site-specific recombinase XerD
MMEDLAGHLTAEGLQASTTAKHLAFFKSFLHWCVKRELTANTRWQKFTIEAAPDTLKVALNKSELDALRNTPLPMTTSATRKGLVLIGCLTGFKV